MSSSEFDERWEHGPNGEAICALINGSRGWLMFLREEGDAGLSSRDANYTGAPDAVMEFQLSNGQIDSYPVSWTLPISEVEQVLQFFRKHAKPAPFVQWHDHAHGEAV